MKRSLLWLDENFEKVACVALLSFLALLMVVNVILVELLKLGLAWASEAALIAFAFFIWLGVSYGLRARKHISITIVNDLLPVRGAQILALVVDVLLIAFFVLVMVYGFQWMNHPAVTGKHSLLLAIPMQAIYFSAPLGALLSVFRLLQNIVVDVRTLRRPAATGLNVEGGD